MRVILAGASGAIGHFLVPQLIEAGHEVIGITRKPGALGGTGATEIVADVLDRPRLLEALKGIKADAVVHQLTSLANAPRTLHDMVETDRLRSEGTSSLIAAARLVGATKLVAASIFYGYGFGDLGPKPLLESARFGFLDQHNDPVLLALDSLEEQVHAFGGISLRYGLFYGGVYSPSPVSRRATGVLPMVHLSDAASAVVLALTNGKPKAWYNIADDEPLTYREREILLAKAAGHRAPLALPDRVLRMAAPFGSEMLTRTSVRMSSELARRELGWEPRYPSLREWANVRTTQVRSSQIPR
jgi:nucleoside-diphosphate-sugar epimerase